MKQKQTKTAAVYDRWLHTLGGGEQVAFAYAETLRDLGFTTTLLTHAKVDTKKAQTKMNVDLTNISIKYIPPKPDYQLASYIKNYDVFISNSYMDYIPNQSKLGILSLFFPTKLSLSPVQYLKRGVIIPFLQESLLYPSQIEGIASESEYHNKHMQWLERTSSIMFNKPINAVSLTLYAKELAVSLIEQITFSINDTKCNYKRTVNHRANTIEYKIIFDNTLSIEQKLLIRLPNTQQARSVALTKINAHKLQNVAYHLFKTAFPRFELRLHGGPRLLKKEVLKTYQVIAPISSFSKKWVDAYWQLPSTIVHPPVAIDDFKPAKSKLNKIVHIGRFFLGGHSKKQLEMVRVFKRLVDSGHTGWELNLIGSVEPGSVHQKYIEHIKAESKGYPVKLHLNIPFSNLQKILSKAKIYWHATGLGEKDHKYPVLLEHFGITTVEAMASGCVPVVINKGGQPEIVTEESGFTWETTHQLFSITSELMQNPELLKKMGSAAIERSQAFSKKAFKNNVVSILKEHHAL